MKFNREKLLAAVDRAIAAHEKAELAKHAKRLEEFEAARKEWVEHEGALWLAFFTEARKKINKGLTISGEDLPRSTKRGRYSWATFDQSPPASALIVTPPALRSLRAVLAASVDEEITQSALRNLGIGPSALRIAVTSLAEAEATDAEVAAQADELAPRRRRARG